MFDSIPAVTIYVREALGEHVNLFDAEAIADEIATWENGQYILKPEIEEDQDSFWEIVRQNEYEITAQVTKINTENGMDEVTIFQNDEQFEVIEVPSSEDQDDYDHAVREALGTADAEIAWAPSIF